MNVICIDIDGNEYEVDRSQLQWRPAAYAIVVRDGAILLSRQHGAWHLPGGGVELGESPEAAVLLEVQEETGYIVENPRLVHAGSNFFTWIELATGEPNHAHSVPLYYVCDFVGGEMSIDGFDEYEQRDGELPEGISLEQLDEIVAGGTVDWRAIVAKAFPDSQIARN